MADQGVSVRDRRVALERMLKDLRNLVVCIGITIEELYGPGGDDGGR